MLKAIWMSDPHFSSASNVVGHNSKMRIEAAVEHVNAHHNDTKLCIISGDLVNKGTPNDYRELKSHLDALVIPYFPMVGNHDNRYAQR